MVRNNNIEMINRKNSISQLSIASNNSASPPYPGLHESHSMPTLRINRVAYNVLQFNDSFDSTLRSKTTIEKLKTCKPDMSKKAWIRRFTTIFPILSWLPKYDIKNNLLSDVVVGVTICVFQIPQSIGYALIAHIPPVYGIYSAFFTPLAYLLMGTSSHSAVGAFAITSGLMTGDVVLQVMTELGKDALGTPHFNSSIKTPVGFEDITNIDIVIMTAVVVGLYIAAFGILQLGFISNYLPNELIGGFLTSASIYVFTSQIRYLLGVNYTFYSGVLALINSYIEIFSRLKEVNLITLLISGCCLITLLVFKEIINVQVEKRLGIKLQFPIDLCLVIAGTLISSHMNLSVKYHVKTVGAIKNGFPPAVAPKFKLFSYVWSRCISIAIVSYVTTLAAGRIYSAKHGYKLDPNQEMVALGVTNIWGGIFQCMPASSSLPRAALMDTSGGKTQVVFIVNCICVAIIIGCLGSLLSPLPSCVIGSCIAIALVSLINKIKEAKRFWDISKIDGSIWIITFIAVIILNVDVGFYVGLGCSVIMLIYKSQRPKTYLLGSIEDSDIYVPLNKYMRAKEVRGVKIFQFCGPLNYADVNYFTSQLKTKSGFDIDEISNKLKKVEGIDQSCCFRFGSSKNSNLTRISVLSEEKLPTHIIIDCSMISYIDTAGANAIKKIVKKYQEIGVFIFLSGCAFHVESLLSEIGFFIEVPSDQVFKTIHDAVTYIKGGIVEEYKEKRISLMNTLTLKQLSLRSPPSDI